MYCMTNFFFFFNRKEKMFSKKRRKLENLLSVMLSNQSAFTCSKLTIETLEQGAKYFQS